LVTGRVRVGVRVRVRFKVRHGYRSLGECRQRLTDDEG